MRVGRYEQIKKEEGNLIKIPKITTFIPTPIEKDYFKGYIVRYFVQKANDVNSVIYEVSTARYSNIQSSDLYINVSLDWRLTGDPIEIKKSNTSSLRIASKTIPKISLYLPNLLQFYKK
jgi:hypothetical protein